MKPGRSPEAVFITQTGRRVSSLDWQGKSTVTAFFFTSCSTICKRMVEQMKRVQALVRHSNQYLILFFTVDPARDTPQKLKDYAKRNDISEVSWWLLTGNDTALQQISAFYAVRAGADKNMPTTFIHDGLFIVNDKEGNMERFNGTDSASVDQLLDKIKKGLER
jgi:protein SCO1/2